MAVWTHTLEVTRPNWIAEMNLGDLLQQRGQTEKALEHFYRAADEEPGNVHINLNIAFIEHERGNLRQAISYYEKVMAVSKDNRINAQVLANMGHAYGALGDEPRAKECYLAALRVRSLSPVPAPRPVINWQGDWWRDLGPFIRERFHYWKSKLTLF